MEQGPWRTEKDFVHDEIKIFNQNWLTNHPDVSPTTFRPTEHDKARVQPAIMYGRGGGAFRTPLWGPPAGFVPPAQTVPSASTSSPGMFAGEP